MAKINEIPYREVERGDTLSLHTFVKYDPMAVRPSTPIMVGGHVVMRRPLPNSVHTLYMIMDGVTVVRTQISYPDALDCTAAIAAHRRSRAAKAAAGDVIKKAKRVAKEVA